LRTIGIVPDMKLFDAHNHLQEPVFRDRLDLVLKDTRNCGIATMVVNGSSETDWPEVLRLA